MDREILEEIIKDGTCGISGDNSQPWRFEISGGDVFIFNLPDRDNPILNVRQRGSYIAHGSLIENIFVSAAFRGYGVNLKIFPDSSRPNLTARLSFFKEESIDKSFLYPYIKNRSTNRKPYDTKPLSHEIKSELFAAADAIAPGRLVFSDDEKLKQEIGRALSTTEKIALNTKELHYLFFKDMVWSEKEEREKRRGLFIKTLELPSPVEGLFKLIRFWPVMRFLNVFGFYRAAAAGNAKIYSAVGAHGIVLAKDEDVDFITAGRIMQRVWLTASKQGLYMQPVTGVLFLHQRVNLKPEPFNKKQIMMVEAAYKTLESAFGVKGGLIAMLFRIGFAKPPSATSSRMTPDIKYKNGF